MSKHALTWAWGVNKNYYFFFQALEEERSQINDLIFYLKELEKEEQTKPRASRKKKIIKIEAEISEIETRKTEKIIKTQNCFFADKPLIDWPSKNLIF